MKKNLCVYNKQAKNTLRPLILLFNSLFSIFSEHNDLCILSQRYQVVVRKQHVCPRQLIHLNKLIYHESHAMAF